MNLQEAFEQGKIKGIAGKPDRIIETVISKLFFFGDDIYKVYKYNKEFFADFSDGPIRHEFYHNDFTWNNTMAPDIYLKLGYMKKNGDIFEEVSPEESEDYYILMKKIDDSNTLFNILKNDSSSIKKEHVEQIVEEMFKRTERLTEIKREDMKDLFNMPYIELDLQTLESTRDWLRMAPDFIPEEEADLIIDKLKEFVSTHHFFKNFDNQKYLTSIDNHGGNILFENGEVNFIDSMPPMRIWRIQSDAYSVSRPATDIEVLVNKSLADAMYEKFETVRNIKLSREMRDYLQVVAALIQAPYMYILKEQEYAEMFWNFAKEKSKNF